MPPSCLQAPQQKQCRKEKHPFAQKNNPQQKPYDEAEQLGIASYQILDSQGTLVKEGSAPAAQVVSGQAAIPLETEGLAPGQYLLNITAFVAEKKADQPLTISGCWQASLEI